MREKTATQPRYFLLDKLYPTQKRNPLVKFEGGYYTYNPVNKIWVKEFHKNHWISWRMTHISEKEVQKYIKDSDYQFFFSLTA